MNKRYTNQLEMTLIIGVHRSRSEAINIMYFRHLTDGIWRCRPIASSPQPPLQVHSFK